MARPLTFISVDTCTLLALAEHDQAAWQTIRHYRTQYGAVVFLVLPTVLAEIVRHAEKSKDTELRRLANQVITELRDGWTDFKLADFIPVGHGIIEQVAKKIHHRELLPSEEWNDALIIGEAALHNSHFLLTEDSHLLGISREALNKILDDADLCPLKIVSYSA